ncbi:exported hypothetical protein [uncultured Eubacteriales bacterium]|uniref:Uncharacterized protein n=1 Tax=uncultured Eubacteriales bacterium TaxID=172733 RepID=A0A212KHH4_9FIRM|nr:exported hypothetical protein [uncultured Eubacteriales bacterium]
MKKLLSAILTLALVCALTAPALAQEEPLWQQWGYESYEDMLTYWTEEEYAESVADYRDWETRKEDYKAAHAAELAVFDAEAYFLEEYPWYSSKEEYMEIYGLADQAAFESNMLDSYVIDMIVIEDYKAEWAALQAKEPERTALFLAELGDWLAENYYYDSADEYLENNLWLTCMEEAYLELFEEWNRAYAYEQEQALRRTDFITAHGGVPGELGVLLNDTYLSFPADRTPYAKNGAVYADAKTLSAALGIDVPAPLDGYSAVRSAAEKAGLRVYWDGYYNTVVLLDPTALAARIDEDFTILNGVLAKWNEAQTGSAKETLQFKGSLTLFDSLDGDKTGSFSLDSSTLRSAQGAQVTGRYDASSLADILRGLMGEMGYYTDGEDMEELDTLFALLKGSFELRVDNEEEMLYLKGDLLDWASAAYSYEDKLPPAGSWYAISLSGLEDSAPKLEGLTVGSLICALDQADHPAQIYDQILQHAARFAQVFGDGVFTKTGQNWTTSFGLEEYTALMSMDNEEDDSYYYDLPKILDLTLTVKSDGTVTGSFAYQPDDYYSDAVTRITADFTLAPKSQKMTVEIHTKNTFKLTLELTGSTSATIQGPATVPPSGANVVEH